MEKQIKQIVEKIKKDKEVVALILYGSYARKKEYARDIDICVMLDKRYSNMVMNKTRLKYLSTLINKFDIQIFQLLPLPIRIKVLKEGKILYSKNIKKIYDIAYDTIKEFRYFEPHYKDYIEVER